MRKEVWKMRKNRFLLKICRTVTAIVLLAGCGNAGVHKTDEQSIQKTEVNKAEEQVATRIQPTVDTLFATEADDEMPDGEYAVSFDPQAVEVLDDGITIPLEFFNYDTYKAEDINRMHKGDILVLAGEEIKVEKIEEIKNNDTISGIDINGGIEQGGAYLVREDAAFYRTCTFNDYPVYYSIGTAKLKLDTNCTFIDYAAKEQPFEEGIIYKYADIPECFVKSENIFYSPNNTIIMVRDGKIVQITRKWIP